MGQPDKTFAAEKYLEQYGEPLVMNTYLKITVLALCAISVALAVLEPISPMDRANTGAKTHSQPCTR